MITNGAEGWRKINFDIDSYVIMVPTNSDPLVVCIGCYIGKTAKADLLFYRDNYLYSIAPT